MVCLGNICRSPMAEGILKEKASKLNIEVLVDSAGTSSWHAGEKPDDRSVLKSKEHGVDISEQKARQFVVEDFELFDIIFVMDTSNYEDVISLAQNEDQKSKVKLILTEDPDSKIRSVPDPYFGAEDGFENVFQMLDKALDFFIKKI